MHTERNFDTMMNNGKTKDTHNARLDLAIVCDQKELKLVDINHAKKI